MNNEISNNILKLVTLETLIHVVSNKSLVSDETLKQIALKHQNPNFRAQALIALCKKNTEFPINEVLTLLSKDKSTHVRCAAAVCLFGNITDEKLEFIIKVLSEEKDEHVRMYLVEALGSINSKETLDVIMDQMNQDPSILVKCVAAGFLFNKGGKIILEKNLTSQSLKEKRAVLRGLKHVEDLSSNSMLLQLKDHDSEPRIRHKAKIIYDNKKKVK